MDNKKAKISDLIYEWIGDAYCDNCRFNGNEEMSDRDKALLGTSRPCDDCLRKEQNWALSRQTADELAAKIMQALEGNSAAKQYKFKLTIGDFSGDGHEKNESFTVASNFPVEVVREAHFKIKEATGIDIESICSEYEQDEIDEESYGRLKALGFQFENKSGLGEQVLCIDEMARLWIFLLMKADPRLTLEIGCDDVSELQFLGTDEHGRSIGSVGYGLFLGE